MGITLSKQIVKLLAHFCEDTKVIVYSDMTNNSPFEWPLFRIHMSHDMTKLNKMSVRPAKTQISLGIHPV